MANVKQNNRHAAHPTRCETCGRALPRRAHHPTCATCRKAVRERARMAADAPRYRAAMAARMAEEDERARERRYTHATDRPLSDAEWSAVDAAYATAMRMLSGWLAGLAGRDAATEGAGA